VPSQLLKHDVHLALSELVLILLHGADRDHVLDELNPRLSKLRLTAYYAATHLDRSCDHLCDNELRLLCVVQPFAVLLGDHHHGTNGRYLDDRDLLADDRDLLEDDPLNHHDHTTDDHRDHRDQKLDDRDLLADDPLNHHGYKTNAHHDHFLDDYFDQMTDDRDLLEDDLLNHHGYKTNAHHDHHDQMTDDRDLLADDPLNHHGYKTNAHHDHHDQKLDDRDLGHHFARMQDDLLDDHPDELIARHDLLTDDHYLDGLDCPKDDPGLRLVCLNDRLRHQHRRDGRDAKVCRILLPVADDVDRDFLGLALDEVYLQTMPKHRTYARWY
jgi:hypothetical protein